MKRLQGQLFPESEIYSVHTQFRRDLPVRETLRKQPAIASAINEIAGRFDVHKNNRIDLPIFYENRQLIAACLYVARFEPLIPESLTLFGVSDTPVHFAFPPTQRQWSYG